VGEARVYGWATLTELLICTFLILANHLTSNGYCFLHFHPPTFPPAVLGPAAQMGRPRPLAAAGIDPIAEEPDLRGSRWGGLGAR
jgi:hypothetical protein